MSPENFCYWLQGLLELQPDIDKLDAAQVKMVRDHLGYVFTHVQANKMPLTSAPNNIPDWVRQLNPSQPLIGTQALSPVTIC